VTLVPFAPIVAIPTVVASAPAGAATAIEAMVGLSARIVAVESVIVEVPTALALIAAVEAMVVEVPAALGRTAAVEAMVDEALGAALRLDLHKALGVAAIEAVVIEVSATLRRAAALRPDKALALGRAAALRPDKALAALRSAPTLWAAVRGSAALGRAAASFDAIAPLAAIMVFLSRRGARRQRQHRQGCNGLFHGRRLFPPPRRGSPTVSSQLGNAAHL
jgi:hypothetical protein